MTNKANENVENEPKMFTVLLLIALLLRMKIMNRKTEMNELRISAVESHMKLYALTNKGNENVGDKTKNVNSRQGNSASQVLLVRKGAEVPEEDEERKDRREREVSKV